MPATPAADYTRSGSHLIVRKEEVGLAAGDKLPSKAEAWAFVRAIGSMGFSGASKLLKRAYSLVKDILFSSFVSAKDIYENGYRSDWLSDFFAIIHVLIFVLSLTLAISAIAFHDLRVLWIQAPLLIWSSGPFFYLCRYFATGHLFPKISEIGSEFNRRYQHFLLENKKEE